MRKAGVLLPRGSSLASRRVTSVVRKAGLLEVVHYGVRSDTDRGWPMCHKCGQPVDAVNMEELTTKYIEVRGKHHDEEDVVRAYFDSPPTEEDISQAWKGMTFFHKVLAVR